MEEMLAQVTKLVSEIGVTGLWAIVLYKGMSLLQMVTLFLLVGWGIKKAWPCFYKLMNE
jgi:hypothetical protein